MTSEIGTSGGCPGLGNLIEYSITLRVLMRPVLNEDSGVPRARVPCTALLVASLRLSQGGSLCHWKPFFRYSIAGVLPQRSASGFRLSQAAAEITVPPLHQVEMSQREGDHDHAVSVVGHFFSMNSCLGSTLSNRDKRRTGQLARDASFATREVASGLSVSVPTRTRDCPD